MKMYLSFIGFSAVLGGGRIWGFLLEQLPIWTEKKIVHAELLF